jgi:hypothetical protein
MTEKIGVSTTAYLMNGRALTGHMTEMTEVRVPLAHTPNVDS